MLGAKRTRDDNDGIETNEASTLTMLGASKQQPRASALAYQCVRAECEHAAHERHVHRFAACQYCVARGASCDADCAGRVHFASARADGMPLESPAVLRVWRAAHRWHLHALVLAEHKWPTEQYVDSRAAGKFALLTKWSRDDQLMQALENDWRRAACDGSSSSSNTSATREEPVVTRRVARRLALTPAPVPTPAAAAAAFDALECTPVAAPSTVDTYDAEERQHSEDSVLCNSRVYSVLEAVAFEVAHAQDRRKCRLHDMRDVDYIALDAETQCTTRRWALLGVPRECLHVPNHHAALVLQAQYNLLEEATAATWHHCTYNEYLQQQRDASRAVLGIYQDTCGLFRTAQPDIALTFRAVRFTVPAAMYAIKCSTRDHDGVPDPQGRCCKYVQQCAHENGLAAHMVYQYAYQGFFLLVFRVYLRDAQWSNQ